MYSVVEDWLSCVCFVPEETAVWLARKPPPPLASTHWPECVGTPERATDTCLLQEMEWSGSS